MARDSPQKYRRVYRTTSSSLLALEDFPAAMNSTLPPKRTSPTRNAINVIGAKLTRVWSRDGTGAQGTESDSEVASLKSGVDEYIRERQCFFYS